MRFIDRISAVDCTTSHDVSYAVIELEKKSLDDDKLTIRQRQAVYRYFVT